MRKGAWVVVLCGGLAAGCGDDGGPGTDGGDGEAGGEADAFDAPEEAAEDAAETEGGEDGGGFEVTDDGGDGGGSCEPRGGDGVFDAHCDLVQAMVLAQTGEATRLRVEGRLSLFAGPVCAVLDRVELVEGGRVIQTLEAGGVQVPEDGGPFRWFEGPGAAEITAGCDGEEGRFEPYGVVIRGRMDGGRFEGGCGSGGGSWSCPPTVVQSCHEGLAEPPFAASGDVSVFGGFVSATFYVTIPHPAGAAVTAVDGTIRILPGVPPGGLPLAPFDAAGWTAYLSEGSFGPSGPASQITLLAESDPLGEQLCPAPHVGPEPPPPDRLPPVFLGRLTGTTERGPFRSEAFVRGCMRLETP